MARPLTTAIVDALADHPATARALDPDGAEMTHVHAGLLGRPYPCHDPRCATRAVPAGRSAVAERAAPVPAGVLG